MKYVIGTRGSKLALVQANYVCDRLKEAYPQHTFEIKIIKTKGDLIQNKPLHQIGDKGLFVKEIEQEILNGKVHIGVHSMKDMPGELAVGLSFTKSWKREDPRDVLILRKASCLEELPQGAVIGTGSKRRQYQLARLRPDLQFVDIRGNVDTRLRKMEEQKLDGIVLAAAGLHRLGMEERITQYLETEEMISAPAQGILALEIRSEDQETRQMLDALSDEETDWIGQAERGFLREIGGSCHMPIGAVCKKVKENTYRLKTVFGNEDGNVLVFSDVEGNDPQQLGKMAVREIYHQLGKVTLVGGGPGDPGLLTVKGLKAIREADCIVYDRLSSPELLQEAKKICEMIYVGKANHHHTMKQEEINQLLAEKVITHKRVVRLKGGDPYVFGRGGEEALFLAAKGISFEVIPGISSSIAGLTYAGIPITHRGIAAGFHVVTAHNKKDELADIDFAGMAQREETCVFLMGLSKVEEIAEHLMCAGMDGKTPAAAISKATTPEQKTVEAPLCELAEKVREANLESPALIVVGKTIALRENLNFFEKRPLFGKTFLVTKVGEQPSALTESLKEYGALVQEIQTGRMEYLQMDLSREKLQELDWLLFTSKHGVEAFFENMRNCKLDMRALGNCKMISIGEKTSECLRQHGVWADVQPSKYHSDALVSLMKEIVKPSEKILYLKAKNADQHLKAQMDGFCQFQEKEIYENVFCVEDGEITVENPEGIVVTCGSSVERLADREPHLWEIWKENTLFYSIGPKTTETLIRYGVKNIREAKKATFEGLVHCILEKKC